MAKDKKVTKKARKTSPFASMSAKDCEIIPKSIWKYASGEKIRRLTLFDQLGKSPDSGPSRTLITASSKYGYTKGGYHADYIELTPDGYKAFNPDETVENQLRAKFKLIIEGNEYFSNLYAKYKDSKIPTKAVVLDYLEELGLEESDRECCFSLFVENLQYIGLIKIISGAERIISIEQLIEELPRDITKQLPAFSDIFEPANDSCENNDFSKTCFYIAPIGNKDSIERKHSDLFLESIITPAIENFGFKVIRADQIGQAGMITNQIIDYIMKSELVICDLSFHNPNVFYELSLRHATKKPTVHIIRKCDNIPFDINDFRTIVIDDTDIYTLLPALETYISQINQQVRQMLETPETIDNPILSYLDKNNLNHL